MSAETLLADFAGRDIVVTTDGQNLRVAGRLTRGDVELLREHKAELLAHLTAANDARLQTFNRWRVRLGDGELCHVLTRERLTYDEFAARWPTMPGVSPVYGSRYFGAAA